LGDRHYFSNSLSDLDKLPSRVQALCFHQENQLVLSLVSVWEMQIKIQIGKLDLGKPLAVAIANQRQTNQIELLPVYYNHVLELDSLPLHHKDPFDRLLLAQARVEDMVILSKDPQFRDYTVPVEWD
jgi:PIN domain nuclease of toxin-antitoxin system